MPFYNSNIALFRLFVNSFTKNCKIFIQILILFGTYKRVELLMPITLGKYALNSCLLC